MPRHCADKTRHRNFSPALQQTRTHGTILDRPQTALLATRERAAIPHSACRGYARPPGATLIAAFGERRKPERSAAGPATAVLLPRRSSAPAPRCSRVPATAATSLTAAAGDEGRARPQRHGKRPRPRGPAEPFERGRERERPKLTVGVCRGDKGEVAVAGRIERRLLRARRLHLPALRGSAGPVEAARGERAPAPEASPAPSDDSGRHRTPTAQPPHGATTSNTAPPIGCLQGAP